MRHLGLALVLAACASAPASRPSAPAAAEERASAWREYTSHHFVVMTDALPERAPRMVAQLERLWSLDLAALVGDQVDTAGRVRVIVPNERGRFRDLVGDGSGGFYSTGIYGQPFVVVPVDAFDRDLEAVAHEVAHAISFYLFPEQSRWFTEGLAAFVETLAGPSQDGFAALGSHLVRGRGKAGAVGRVPRRFEGIDVRFASVPAKDLLAWKGVEDPATPGRYHVWGWLLYHWLWNQRSQQFSAYQKKLADGVSPADAWTSSLPDLDPANPAAMEKLDSDLRAYADRGRFTTYNVSADPDVTFREEACSPADLRLWLLQARRHWPETEAAQKSLVQAEVAEALREEPRNPLARIRAVDGAVTLDLGRSLVHDAPGDWRSWYALGSAATDPNEKEKALRKAVELSPDSASAQNQLAWFLATAGRSKEALPFANRAVDLAPWDGNVIDTLAETAARMGKCREALQLEHRAVRMARTAQQTDSLKARVADVEKRCGTVTAATRG